MAGQWLKYDTDLPEKPEVWALSESLDLDPDAVVGKLLRIWTWFDSHTEEGNAPTVTKALLDRKVSVPNFCDCMIQVGWMIEEDGMISLPNFDRHNGKTAKNRALTAKRVAQHKKKTNADGNGEVTKDALPREEKRRDITPTSRAPIPKDWKPDQESLDYAQIHRLPHSDLEVQKFKDHYASEGKLTADPDALYRKWLANARPTGGSHGKNRNTGESRGDRADRELEQFQREAEEEIRRGHS